MIHIRAATADDAYAIADVHVAAWRETYRGIVPEEYLAGLSVERRERMWSQILSDPAFTTGVFIATDDTGHVVGFASGGPRSASGPAYAPYTGDLYAIYLLREAQGQGAGAALLRAVAAWLVERGMRSMLVWVLAENPSRGFYAAQGGMPVGEEEIEIGGKRLVEVAYGWPDVDMLVKES
jgi:GNAT superfamily N-acetyltransferase